LRQGSGPSIHDYINQGHGARFSSIQSRSALCTWVHRLMFAPLIHKLAATDPSDGAWPSRTAGHPSPHRDWLAIKGHANCTLIRYLRGFAVAVRVFNRAEPATLPTHVGLPRNGNLMARAQSP